MGLLNRIEELEKELLELKEQVKEEQGFPKDGDTYWYIGMRGNIFTSQWDSLPSEEIMLEFGNIFKNEEQASFTVEKLKVEAELRKLSRPFENGKFNYYIFFYIDGDDIEVGYKRDCYSQGAIYFESEEKAKQAIETVGEKRIKKYLFGVEE